MFIEYVALFIVHIRTSCINTIVNSMAWCHFINGISNKIHDILVAFQQIPNKIIFLNDEGKKFAFFPGKNTFGSIYLQFSFLPDH
jgi:hypothetical protein